MALPHILIVDERVHALRSLSGALRAAHPEWNVSAVDSPVRAVALIEREPVDVVITEAVFDEMRGARFVAWLAERDPDLPCLILTERPDLAPRRSVSPNVQRVLLKPAQMDVLEACVARALRARQTARQARVERVEPRPIVSAVACSTRLFAVNRAIRSGR
jgi:DNA-binding NtrC family response regulator